jgi:hypothetical protein
MTDNRMHVLANDARRLIREGDRATKDAEKIYRKAGQKLALLKEQHRKAKARKPNAVRPWAEYVQHRVGVSRRRADELISIAAGRATVAKTRKRKSESMRKSRNLARSNGRHVAPKSGKQQNGKRPAACDLDPKWEEHRKWFGSSDAEKSYNLYKWHILDLKKTCECLLRETKEAQAGVFAFDDHLIELTLEAAEAWSEFYETWQQKGTSSHGTNHATTH